MTDHDRYVGLNVYNDKSGPSVYWIPCDKIDNDTLVVIFNLAAQPNPFVTDKLGNVMLRKEMIWWNETREKWKSMRHNRGEIIPSFVAAVFGFTEIVYQHVASPVSE
jgi:hypothetical protein